MAIRVKRTDKLLFTEGITAHFIASLELFEGGDVDFARRCYNVLPPDPCITLPYSTNAEDQPLPVVLSARVTV